MDRLNDEEAIIRANTVIAHSKLIGSEDPDEVEQGERTILQTISTDPAACVLPPYSLPLELTTLHTIHSEVR